MAMHCVLINRRCPLILSERFHGNDRKNERLDKVDIPPSPGQSCLAHWSWSQ